jgi:hypothetical protein
VPERWLPDDLRQFYSTCEGVGLDSTSDRPVRLCRLNELRPVSLQDIGMFRGYEPEDSWADFSGVRIGAGCFGDEIVYILRAPLGGVGSIAAFGCDISGPGGSGEDANIPGSLVLAGDFQDWLIRLAKDEWHEYGLVAGEIDKLPDQRAAELRRHFRKLNPRITWGGD